MARSTILRLVALASTAWAAEGAVKLAAFAKNLVQPVAVLEDPLPSGNRKFVVEKGGAVKVLNRRGALVGTFVSLSSVVTQDVNEGGLLGMAFHPDYATNGYFFVNYTTRTNGKLFTVIRRLKVSDANPNVAVVGSAANEEVLRFAQPFDNHNGGQLVFGPKDGMLYIGTGDGGSGGDPQNNAQSRTTLLGKILRISPSTDPSQAGYAIPSDNPFANAANGVRGEIWHYGLRNPWRFTFDRATGDMYIGDVGQSRLEEIDLARHGIKGRNFGWRRKEGNLCYNPATNCLEDRTVVVSNPIVVYGRSVGRSVTGGYLYRGSAIPSLAGKYVFADFASGAIFVASKRANKNRWTRSTLLSTGRSISSFGEARDGELFVVDFAGAVWRLVDA